MSKLGKMLSHWEENAESVKKIANYTRVLEGDEEIIRQAMATSDVNEADNWHNLAISLKRLQPDGFIELVGKSMDICNAYDRWVIKTKEREYDSTVNE